MDAASALLVLLAAGVNFGWQPAEESPGGYEYIVQIEPELLDVLRRGESVPIESNVPPEVGPIRKVSIVFGRDDLPRDSANLVEHTAYFAGQGGWTPDRVSQAPPPASSAYDPYGQVPNATTTGVSPPPSVIARAQAAVTETGTTLSEGVQAANQQLSRTSEQVFDATRNAGQEFGQQLQGFANDPVGQFQSATNSVRGATEQTFNSVGNQVQQVTSPFGASSPQPTAIGTQTQSGVSPPPMWPQSGTAATASSANPVINNTAPSASTAALRTPSGWTSIGSNLAAPPLIIPQISPASTNRESLRTASGGPSFPAAADSSAVGSGWDTGATASQATIGLAGNAPAIGASARDSNLVPVQPLSGSDAQSPQQPANGWSDPWGHDPWGQPSQSVSASQHAAQNSVTGPSGGSNSMQNAGVGWPIDPNSAAAANRFPQNQTPIGNGGSQDLAGINPSGPQPQNPAPAGATQPQLSVAAEQPPWLPLLVASLSLVGSLSANLFLGWSYIDARQKYRSLVRKTADTFRRATTAAA